MIANILLVAAREFRQIAGMRSFWVTLLILPAALAIGPIAQRMIGSDDIERVMLIDRNGREATAIRERLDLDQDRRVLTALSRYSERYHLDKADPAALWAQHDRLYGNVEVAAFARSGGVKSALSRMKPAMTDGTPAFDPPKPDFEIVPVPAALTGADPATLDARLKPLMKGSDAAGKSRPKPLNYVLYIPADFGTGGASARLWAADQPGQRFLQPVQSVLTQNLRNGYLRAAGLTPEQAANAATLTPAIEVIAPPPGGGAERVFVRSILPLLAAYILLMSLLLSGSWMLQGLVEERSNKLIETVLACISPDELLFGKLAGTVAIGLTMVVVWVGFAGIAAFATQGAVAQFLRPALAPLSSPGIIVAMLYFFVTGYLMVSMIFLAIGAMSDSMRDAQSYLTPVILVIAMPFAVLAQAILSDKSGIGVTIMTWVPIYTPFTMLARLGVGVPVWEIIGSGVTLAIFVGIEFVALGRVFRASLLGAGQKPSLAGIARLMRRAPV